MSDPTSTPSTPSAATAPPSAPHARRWPAPWRIVVWALLLLAAFGVLQYAAHAWRVWHMLGQTTTVHHVALQRMLWWDGGYLLLAGLTVSMSAGTLLQREWARRGMRVLALVLALWALATAILLLLQWGRFQHAQQMLLSQPGVTAAQRSTLAHLRGELLTGIVLKCLAVPVLGWLCWRLGRRPVRGQFMRRRRPRAS